MNFSQVIMDIIVVFMLVAAFDKVTQGKFRLGLRESFDEGIEAMGPLALSVIGMLSLAPALEGVVLQIIGPVYRLLGADPAMFAGLFLSSDTGGYALAEVLTDDYQVVCFSGLMLASVLGVVISFTIPIALGIITEDDRPYFAQGVLYGIITAPIGAIAGGFSAGFPARLILINSIPTIVIAMLLAIGVKFFMNAMIKGFHVFGKIITAIITIGLAAAIVEALLGIRLIRGLAPISEGFVLVGTLAIVLAGAFPMLHVITKVLHKPLGKVGKALYINEFAVAGFIASLANAIPALALMNDMDKRGKIINAAFIVSGSFLLGDHLAYTASVDRGMLVPVMVAKSVAGILAVIMAVVLTKNMSHEKG